MMKRIAMAAVFAAAAGTVDAGGQVTRGQAGPSPSIQVVIVASIVNLLPPPSGGTFAQSLRDFYGNASD